MMNIPKTFYILFLFSTLLSCGQKSAEPVSHTPADSSTGVLHTPTEQGTEEDDSDDQAAFTLADLTFTPISKTDFDAYVQAYQKQCTQSPVMDSAGAIKKLGMFVEDKCDETCKTYLKETASGRQKRLPSNFDQGILGLFFSPNGSRLLMYSSCNGAEYKDRYDWRAELFTYTIAQEEGLDGVQPDKYYYATDWSIEQITWINEITIALKVYTGNKTGDSSGVTYNYIKTTLN